MEYSRCCSFAPYVKSRTLLYFQYPTFDTRWIRLGAPIRASGGARVSEMEMITRSRGFGGSKMDSSEPPFPPSFIADVLVELGTNRVSGMIRRRFGQCTVVLRTKHCSFRRYSFIKLDFVMTYCRVRV